MYLSAGSNRATFHEDTSSLSINLPAKRRFFAACFLIVWLIFWFLALMIVLAQIFQNIGSESTFLLIWVLICIFAGTRALATLMWHIAGRETLILSDKTLTITRSIPVWSHRAEYPLKHVQDIRLREQPKPRNKEMGIFNRSQGEIIFTYDDRTIGFGLELDQTDAEILMKRIMARYLTSTSRP